MSNDLLYQRVAVLRDEVLNTAELGERDGAGGEAFDAMVRLLRVQGDENPGLDLTLHERITQRLAYGDPEGVVLADANSVCKRLLQAAERSFTESFERMAVAESVAEVGSVIARIVASAALGRAGRERAAIMREENAQERLRDALDKQAIEIGQLEMTPPSGKR